MSIKKIAIDIKSAQKEFVKKAKLQEVAKDHVEKHIGGMNYWDRQNGARMKLKRIHTK